MRSFAAAASLGLAAATLASAAPTQKNPQFPLADGFPFPNDDQLDKIGDRAFGTLSNADKPPKFKEDTFTSVRLIAFSETIEVEFFTQLVNNITENKPGYDQIPNRDFTLKALQSMIAVEEMHAINANKALKLFEKNEIQPCQYMFPVNSFNESIAFISRTTDFVQGVLGDVITKAGTVGDAGFTRGVAGALSDEGEQDGFFRSILGLRPNQKPFNTIATREYAFSLIQDLIVPGSCPNAKEIDLPVIQPLNAADPPAKTVDIPFTFSLRPTRHLAQENHFQKQGLDRMENFAQKYEHNWGPLKIHYLNGQDKPIPSTIKSLTLNGEEVTVVAEFPFDEFKMFGLSVAALTIGDGFANSDEMVKATIFGPALLETIEEY